MSRPAMFTKEWWLYVWKKIEGNFYWYLICGLLSGLTAVIHSLVGTLSWWRQSLIIFCFSLVIIWAAVATWRRRSTSNVESRIAKNQSDIFSPLQIEAFTLMKDVVAFLVEIGKRPEPNKADFGYDPKTGNITAETTTVQVMEYNTACQKMQEPWVLKSESIWRDEFSERVERIAPKFGREGLDANELLRKNDEVTRNLFNDRTVFEIAEALIYLSHDLDIRKVPLYADTTK